MNYKYPVAVIAGILAGRFFMPESWLEPLQHLTMIALYLLLFGIGVNLFADSDIGDLLRSIKPRALWVVPLSAAGSIIGCAVAMLFIGDSPWLGAAIGAGFGWYSLSGVILAGELGALAGALAFLSNVLRELLALMLLPLAIKRCGLAGITIGGATTMDTTLALIGKSGDQMITLSALVHGMALSSLVPVLVPLLAQFVVTI